MIIIKVDMIMLISGISCKISWADNVIPYTPTPLLGNLLALCVNKTVVGLMQTFQWIPFDPRGTAPLRVHSLSLSVAYMRRWIGSALVQAMACRLFGAKPLLGPVLSIGPLGTNLSEIWVEIQNCSFIWNCRLQNGSHLSRRNCGNGV